MMFVSSLTFSQVKPIHEFASGQKITQSQANPAKDMLWNNLMPAVAGIVSTQLLALPPASTLVNMADDFSVSSGTWSVDKIETIGGYELTATTLADSFVVIIYSDAGGPGSILNRQAFTLSASITDTAQEFLFSPAISLTSGKYWLSVYAVYNTGDSLETARWNWHVGDDVVTDIPQMQDFIGLFGLPPFPWTTISALGLTFKSALFAIYGSGVSGVNEIELNASVDIFPNPTSDILNINCSFDIDQVRIYNTFGQLIKAENGVNNNLAINTSDFTSGMYILHIETVEGRIVKNFIVK